MQTTSAIWDELWASGTATLDAVAVIGGVEYTDISAPLITRGTMQGQLSVGNVVSACCALSVRAASSAIPRSATVQIKQRLVSADGATVSEWLPAGTFYISRRRVDPINGVVILECYDALLKSNEDMPELTGVTYPISMTVAAQTIAQIIGVDIDARTVVRTGAEYIIGAPTAGTTMRDILATIAGANAGNWIITPAGKLRLVPVVDVTGSASPLAVSGVIGGIQIGDAGTVTGVRREDEDGNQILIGTDGGIIVDVGLSAPLALAASEILIGQVYQPYAMTGAVYSPAAEIGDPVDADGTGTVIGVLYNETASLGPAYRGDISAPGATEYSNEYPFIGGNAKTLTLARAYAREVTQALDNSLDQEEVFNRLTDNGLIQGLYMLNGQLYVNANYIRSGTLVLGGLNDVNGLLQVKDSNNNVFSTLAVDGFVIHKSGYAYGFYVSPYGLLTVGKTPSSPTLFDNNDSFQVINGMVKLVGLRIYGSSSDGGQCASISPVGYGDGGIIITGKTYSTQLAQIASDMVRFFVYTQCEGNLRVIGNVSCNGSLFVTGDVITSGGIRCYIVDETGASDTWLDAGISGINCKPPINGFYIDDQGYVCQKIRSDT